MYHSRGRSLGAVTADYPVGTIADLAESWRLPNYPNIYTQQFKLAGNGLWYAQGVSVVFPVNSLNQLMGMGAKIGRITVPGAGGTDEVVDALQEIDIPNFNQPDIEIPDLDWVTPDPVELPPSAFQQPSGNGLMKYLPWAAALGIGFLVFKKLF